jgi:hypothetical protein
MSNCIDIAEHRDAAGGHNANLLCGIVASYKLAVPRAKQVYVRADVYDKISYNLKKSGFHAQHVKCFGLLMIRMELTP